MKKKAEKIQSKTVAKDAAIAASNLKANDIRVLDLCKLSGFTDYFVICSGTSGRHIQSIADNIEIELKKKGYKLIGIEGYSQAEWILIDFGGVVAHVFYPEARVFYNIERLWRDAKPVSIRGVTS